MDDFGAFNKAWVIDQQRTTRATICSDLLSFQISFVIVKTPFEVRFGTRPLTRVGVGSPGDRDKGSAKRQPVPQTDPSRLGPQHKRK